MRTRHLTRALGCAALLALPAALHAQYTAPNIITTPGDVVSVLGKNLFINHGLVGVGRIPASSIDGFGESFGSVSGLQVTDWTKIGDNSYAGTFNILPDRGYNSGAFYSDYAARIQRVSFTFTAHTGGPIGGSDLASKIAAQNQILITSVPSGTKFQYLDAIRSTLSGTTGLDPDTGFTALFGATVPYVIGFTGPNVPGGSSTSHPNLNKLPIDAEALALKSDGSGYIGDEYGANVYYFNSSKQIVGVVGIPEALRPRRTVGGNYYFGASDPAPVEGRRINQGFEGVALSPDGSRLFALLQSATMQDSAGAATRLQTRLLVYDVSSNPTPLAPTAAYALTLPTYRTFGDGGAVNATAAQSEVVALDNERILVLSRDGNGLGNATYNVTSPIGGLPSVFKSVLLVDLTIGNPTNFAGTSRNDENGKITSSAGVLASSIVPVRSKEVLNLLNSTQLGAFNIALDAGGTTQVSPLTLSEKWEGLSLVPAHDPLHPHDYFLFVANDNDFLTSTGSIRGPNGALVAYDGFNGYDPKRQPRNAGPGATNNNDTLFLAFRVTSVYDPDAPDFSGLPTDCSVWPPNHKMVRVATISASDPLSGLAPGSFKVTAVSDDSGATGTDAAVVPDGAGGFDVLVRADKAKGGGDRTYTIHATATDMVGNIATAQASCVVPHDQGKKK